MRQNRRGWSPGLRVRIVGASVSGEKAGFCSRQSCVGKSRPGLSPRFGLHPPWEQARCPSRFAASPLSPAMLPRTAFARCVEGPGKDPRVRLAPLWRRIPQSEGGKGLLEEMGIPQQGNLERVQTEFQNVPVWIDLQPVKGGFEKLPEGWLKKIPSVRMDVSRLWKGFSKGNGGNPSLRESGLFSPMPPLGDSPCLPNRELLDFPGPRTRSWAQKPERPACLAGLLDFPGLPRTLSRWS